MIKKIMLNKFACYSSWICSTSICVCVSSITVPIYKGAKILAAVVHVP